MHFYGGVWEDTAGYNVQKEGSDDEAMNCCRMQRDRGRLVWDAQHSTFRQGNLFTTEPQRKDSEENMVVAFLWCPRWGGYDEKHKCRWL